MEAIVEYGKIGNCIKDKGCYKVWIDGTENGFCFKDVDAYENRPDEPCYVNEYAQEDATMEPDGSILIYPRRKSDRERYYTKKDFLELAKYFFEGNEKDYECHGIYTPEQLADFTFDTVDWQSPETYMTELTLFD